MADMMDETFATVRPGMSEKLTLRQIQEKGLPSRWKTWQWEGLSTSEWLADVFTELNQKRTNGR